MNLVYLFMTSAAFGIMVAAPVGPMALLCMRRTLALGWRQGMATGSGIAVADAIYAAVAAFGLTGLARAAAGHDRLLQGAAGIVLILLGVKSLFQRARPTGSGAEPAAVQPPWPAAFAGAVLLTLANPPTIVTFAALFAALAPGQGFDIGVAGATVAGVFVGSIVWWMALTGSVARFRHIVAHSRRQLIERLAGSALIVFGLYQLAKAL